jgi:hypothetical protein
MCPEGCACARHKVATRDMRTHVATRSHQLTRAGLKNRLVRQQQNGHYALTEKGREKVPFQPDAALNNPGLASARSVRFEKWLRQRDK